MEITLDELLKGKSTRIRNNQFLPTEAYVEPFLDRMSKYTSDFRVQVKLPEQITTNQNGEIITDDITYNRVYIQAVLPQELSLNNHEEVIGMVYGIDTRKPIAKMFKGALNCACTNLCVFNPDMLSVQEITPESAIDFRPLNKIIEQNNDVITWLKQLINCEFDCSEKNINESVGRWVRNLLTKSYDSGFGKVKLATSTAVDAYKLLFLDTDSPYYVNDGNTNMFNVYNAFTQLITNNRPKEIINECEKTLLIKQILEF